MKVKVKVTDIDKKVFDKFDYEFSGETEFQEHTKYGIPEDFSIGVIVGSSGSGKSTLLKEFGTEEDVIWDNTKSIVSNFKDEDDAIERLTAVGLNSIPSWGRPRNVLSTGEGFRCDVARRLGSNIVIDEFTSVVNRETAKSLSMAFAKYVRRKGLKNIVIATCHSDILEWLEPDWIYTTDNRQVSRGSLRRPNIVLEVLPCSYEIWSHFSKHHYLTEDLNVSSRCWIATWLGTPVGFVSAIAYPSGTVKNGWREHRTVVLPDFQGMGIGVRLSDAIAEYMVNNGCRYFSKTVHPRMGEYRERKDEWRPTAHNKQPRNFKEEHKSRWACRDVVSYCHEYVGKK